MAACVLRCAFDVGRRGRVGANLRREASITEECPSLVSGDSDENGSIAMTTAVVLVRRLPWCHSARSARGVFRRQRHESRVGQAARRVRRLGQRYGSTSAHVTADPASPFLLASQVKCSKLMRCVSAAYAGRSSRGRGCVVRSVRYLSVVSPGLAAAGSHVTAFPFVTFFCLSAGRRGGSERLPLKSATMSREQESCNMLLFLRQQLPRQLRVSAIRSLVYLAPSAASCGVPHAPPARCFASGGMFDSLASSMGATFKRLLGRKTLTKEEVDAALASVNDALVDADVAQVNATRAVPRNTRSHDSSDGHQLLHSARANPGRGSGVGIACHQNEHCAEHRA